MLSYQETRMQAMIVAGVSQMPLLKRFIKIASWGNHYHNAEGTYNHQEKAVLLTVITRAEFEFKYIMKS